MYNIKNICDQRLLEIWQVALFYYQFAVSFFAYYIVGNYSILDAA